MRLVLTMLVLLGTLPAAAAQTIPVDIEQHQIIARVAVGESGPLDFLVDTGAQQTVIAADRVAEGSPAARIGSICCAADAR